MAKPLVFADSTKVYLFFSNSVIFTLADKESTFRAQLKKAGARYGTAYSSFGLAISLDITPSARTTSLERLFDIGVLDGMRVSQYRLLKTENTWIPAGTVVWK